MFIIGRKVSWSFCTFAPVVVSAEGAWAIGTSVYGPEESRVDDPAAAGCILICLILDKVRLESARGLDSTSTGMVMAVSREMPLLLLDE